MLGNSSAFLRWSVDGVEHSVLVLRDLGALMELVKDEESLGASMGETRRTLEVHVPGSDVFESVVTELAIVSSEPNAIVRKAVREISAENVQIYENLRATQERCTGLLMKARDWRRKIVELGGEDPGPP